MLALVDNEEDGSAFAGDPPKLLGNGWWDVSDTFALEYWMPDGASDGAAPPPLGKKALPVMRCILS